MILVLVGGKRKKLGAVEDLPWESVSAEELLSRASTLSLMGDKKTLRFTGALAGERADEFLDCAKELSRSPHLFVFEEEKLLKRKSDILTKAGAAIESQAVVKKEEAFNVFALASVFAMRDRKKFWLSLVKAFREDTAPEAVAGMLHWKVRDLLAKGGGKYTHAELKKISRELVMLYHDSHRGAGPLELLLERFALKL